MDTRIWTLSAPATDAPPERFQTGKAELDIPLRYFPETWVDPLFEDVQSYLSITTRWPDFADSTDATVRRCGKRGSLTDPTCVGIIFITLHAVYLPGETHLTDPPDFHSLIDQRRDIFGRHLYTSPNWPSRPRVIDLGSLARDGIRSLMDCKPDESPVVSQNVTDSKIQAIAEALSSGSTICHLRLRPETLPIEIEVYFNGTLARKWREVAKSIVAWTSNMEVRPR